MLQLVALKLLDFLSQNAARDIFAQLFVRSDGRAVCFEDTSLLCERTRANGGSRQALASNVGDDGVRIHKFAAHGTFFTLGDASAAVQRAAAAHLHSIHHQLEANQALQLLVFVGRCARALDSGGDRGGRIWGRGAGHFTERLWEREH